MMKLYVDLVRKSSHFRIPITLFFVFKSVVWSYLISGLFVYRINLTPIDLSDNEIVKLENFPYLSRLGTLLVNNNRITRINPNIGEFLPKLHTLVLTNNRLTNLVEIDPLASLPKLQFLSLLDNNITKKPNYRLYVIHKLKSLRLLDFKKVKHKERIEAKNLFSSEEAEEEAKKESAKTFVPGEAPSTPENPKLECLHLAMFIQVAIYCFNILTMELQAAIVNSQTLEEVARLEKALKSGQLPADLKIGDNDATTNTEATKEDKMVTDEENEANDGPSDAEPEQKNNESADMEQLDNYEYIDYISYLMKAVTSQALTFGARIGGCLILLSNFFVIADGEIDHVLVIYLLLLLNLDLEMYSDALLQQSKWSMVYIIAKMMCVEVVHILVNIVLQLLWNLLVVLQSTREIYCSLASTGGKGRGGEREKKKEEEGCEPPRSPSSPHRQLVAAAAPAPTAVSTSASSSSSSSPPPPNIMPPPVPPPPPPPPPVLPPPPSSSF
ncbi:hypothetical protein HYC85_003311 [Camellia sinensis]|uniref:U2A'/phosphoprotein 32 family A C-terminal domain-containing protein n=1 Tax=Camellia sinensis TaxID=4442 RepID=A0A7J7IAZ3_CAMSI|nr:hypothetical protein HYC85_003311 [Camellia sinensis]